VLVDEYQDTNIAQHRIVWQLTKERQRICVVGDDSQSIYSFRGANIDNILKFREMYQGCKLFKLERNYRSTQTIVAAANSLIKKNSMQIDKNVFSENERGERIPDWTEDRRAYCGSYYEENNRRRVIVMEYIMIGFCLAIGWTWGKAVSAAVAKALLRVIERTEWYQDFVPEESKNKNKRSNDATVRNQIGFRIS
jgi:hypothetical protein